MGRGLRPGGTVGIALLATLASRGAAGAVKPPEGPWTEVVTARFIVFGNDYADHVREAAARLEEIRDLLGDAGLGWGADVGEPAVVCAFRDEPAFSAHVTKMRRRSWFLEGETRFRPLSPEILVDLEEYGAWLVLAHEAVHDAVARRYANLPSWFHEGLAETFSTLRVDGNDVTIAVVPAHYNALHWKPDISLDALFASGKPDSEMPLYRWGWGFVYYATVARPEYADGLRRLAAAVNAGRPAKAAFETAFGVPRATFEKEMNAYYAAEEPLRTRIPLRAPAARSIPPATAVAPDEVLLRLGDLMADGEPRISSRGRQYVAAYLSRHPDAPRALSAMAEIDAGRGDRRTAAAEFERAIEGDRSDPKTLFRAAWNLLSMAVGSDSIPDEPPSRLPEPAARARQHLRRLLEIRPDSASASWLLGLSYALDPGDPAGGIEALRASDALSPLDAQTLGVLVGFLVRAGKREEAERVVNERLKPLEDPAALERARRRLGAPAIPP